MAVKYRPTWEKKGIWIAKQDAWGTPSDSTDDQWSKYRATTLGIPTGIGYLHQNIGAMGSGLPYPIQDADGHKDFVLIPQATTQSVTLPLTETVLLDFGSLLTQGYNNDAGTAGAEAEFIVPVDPTVDKWATTMIYLSAYGDEDADYRGTSMVLRDLNINIPQRNAMDGGGLVTATLNFIGEKGERGDDYSIHATPTVDYGTVFLPSTTVFYMGSTPAARTMVSAQINMTNNAVLLPLVGTSPAAGAILGAFNVTGSVTVLDSEHYADSAYEELMDAQESSTYAPLDLRWLFKDADSDNDQYIDLMAGIDTVSDPFDIGGLSAFTFNFHMMVDASADAPFGLRSGAASSAAQWFEDQSP